MIAGKSRKRTVLVVAALAVCIGLIALFGRAVASRAWSNAGMLSLDRALRSLQAQGRGELAEVEARLRKALEIDGRNAAAHRGLGFVLWERGAREQAGEAWRAGGIEPVVFRQTAAQAKRNGDREKALDWYYRAIAIAPASSASYASVASILSDMDEKEQALAMLDTALSLDAFGSEWLEVSAHASRADILYGLQLGREAMAEYEWVLQRRPEDYWANTRFGGLLWELEQDSVRAETYLLRAIEIRPTEKWAYLRLGDLYREVGRAAEALQSYLKALEIEPDDQSTQRRIDAVKAGDSP